MNCKHEKSGLFAFVVMFCVLFGCLTGIMAQQSGKRTITGTVVDEDNQPLPGVTIVVTGTTIGTITDMNGNYSLQIDGTVQSLKYSSIGYKPQTLPLPEGNRLMVKLSTATQELVDVVVVGYGV